MSEPTITRPVPGLPNQEPAHEGISHVASFRSLLGVFLALVVLTGVTYAVSLVNFGEFNLVVALLIAVIKASLVVLYFMHLRYDKPFNSIVFVGCLIFVALFIGLALLDSQQYQPSVSHDQAPGVKAAREKANEAHNAPAGGATAPQH